MRRTPFEVLWFEGPLQHHAFVVTPAGQVEPEACCGLDLDACQDEPARDLAAFEAAPACVACLAVVEMDLPR